MSLPHEEIALGIDAASTYVHPTMLLRDERLEGLETTAQATQYATRILKARTVNDGEPGAVHTQHALHRVSDHQRQRATRQTYTL